MWPFIVVPQVLMFHLLSVQKANFLCFSSNYNPFSSQTTTVILQQKEAEEKASQFLELSHTFTAF